MGKPKNMAKGEIYGYWTVIDPYTDDPGYASCQCSCGTICKVKRCHLRDGSSKSCRQCGSKRAYSTKPMLERKTYIDGRSKEPLYITWWSIKSRCEKPNHISYKNYGARGIKICEEWHDYSTFRQWALDSGWNEDMQIDRIDNNGDYCPENCRITTPKQNANNRSNNRLLMFNGRTQTLTQWADENGWNPDIIQCRLKRGWSVERALTEPPHYKKKKV